MLVSPVDACFDSVKYNSYPKKEYEKLCVSTSEVDQ